MIDEKKIKMFTFAAFTTERIDHIFVTPATTVDAYAVLTSGYWSLDSNNSRTRRTFSDHYPVFSRIRF